MHVMANQRYHVDTRHLQGGPAGWWISRSLTVSDIGRNGIGYQRKLREV